MKTKEEKKQFALEQIAPYYHNPELCGYDKEYGACQYKTSDGRMCVAGKNMLNPDGGEVRSIRGVLDDVGDDQSMVFIPSSVNILTVSEWEWLQSMHDGIAANAEIDYDIKHLNLFTLEELKAFKNEN